MKVTIDVVFKQRKYHIWMRKRRPINAWYAHITWPDGSKTKLKVPEKVARSSEAQAIKKLKPHCVNAEDGCPKYVPRLQDMAPGDMYEGEDGEP